MGYRLADWLVSWLIGWLVGWCWHCCSKVSTCALETCIRPAASSAMREAFVDRWSAALINLLILRMLLQKKLTHYG